MNIWLAILQKAWKYRASILLAIVILLVFVIWKFPHQVTVVREVPAPYVAPTIVETVRTVIKEVKVPVLVPTPSQATEIVEEIGGPLPQGDLLSVVEEGPLPDGALVVVSQPAPEKPVVVTVYPRPIPFFKWELKNRSLGLYTPVDKAGLEMDWQQNIARIGPVTTQVKLDTGDLINKRNLRILVGGRIAF